MAARQWHGDGAGVEAIHLTDDAVTPIELKPRKLANREAKMQELSSAIAAGHFPRRPNDRVCPRCPHYVTCGPVPEGRLVIPSEQN